MTEKRPSSSYKVTPEEYGAFIAQLNISGVYLSSSTLKRMRMPNLEGDLTFEEKFGRNKFEATEAGFCALYPYTISLVESGEETPFGEIRCVFAAEYTSEMPLTKELFEVFRDLNLPLNVWPYVREYVHSATHRMGLPTLVLRSLKR